MNTRPRIRSTCRNLRLPVGGTERPIRHVAEQLSRGAWMPVTGPDLAACSSAAAIIFLIGLISEQITSLTYRRDS